MVSSIKAPQPLWMSTFPRNVLSAWRWGPYSLPIKLLDFFVLCFHVGDGDADDESRDTTDFYTVEDVVEQLGFGWYQLGITLFSGSLWVSIYSSVCLFCIMHCP